MHVLGDTLKWYICRKMSYWNDSVRWMKYKSPFLKRLQFPLTNWWKIGPNVGYSCENRVSRLCICDQFDTKGTTPNKLSGLIWPSYFSNNNKAWSTVGIRLELNFDTWLFDRIVISGIRNGLQCRPAELQKKNQNK